MVGTACSSVIIIKYKIKRGDRKSDSMVDDSVVWVNGDGRCGAVNPLEV